MQTVLSGREATELYLQCYQLILWKQCYWLINVKGFAKELETVVRDLWGLRVRLLHGEKDYDGGYGSGTVGFSSTSEGDNTDTDGGMSRSSKWSEKNRRNRREALPKLIETLALCYLGILLLRLPTSLGEIFKWATTEEMVYTRAVSLTGQFLRMKWKSLIDQIKEIPKEMRSRLPAHFHLALETRGLLKGSSIYTTVLERVEFYHLQFEMVFPPLNAPLLIFKHVRDLGLPSTFFYTNMVYNEVLIVASRNISRNSSFS